MSFAGEKIYKGASFVSQNVAFVVVEILTSGVPRGPCVARLGVPKGPERKIVCPTRGQITSPAHPTHKKNPLLLQQLTKVIKQHDLCSSWSTLTYS